MKVIYTAPAVSPYHDNTTWLALGRLGETPNYKCGGVWLKPGQMLAILDPGEEVPSLVKDVVSSCQELISVIKSKNQ